MLFDVVVGEHLEKLVLGSHVDGLRDELAFAVHGGGGGPRAPVPSWVLVVVSRKGMFPVRRSNLPDAVTTAVRL